MNTQFTPACTKIYCDMYNDEYQALSDVSKNEILKNDAKCLAKSSQEIDEYLLKTRKDEIEFYTLVDKVLEINPVGVGSYLNDVTDYRKEELAIATEISEYHPRFYLIMLAAYHRHTYYINDNELHKKECEIVNSVLEYKNINKRTLGAIEKAVGKDMIESVGGSINAIRFYKALQNSGLQKE